MIKNRFTTLFATLAIAAPVVAHAGVTTVETINFAGISGDAKNKYFTTSKGGVIVAVDGKDAQTGQFGRVTQGLGGLGVKNGIDLIGEINGINTGASLFIPESAT